MNSTRSVAVTRALKLAISSAVLALLAITLGVAQPASASVIAVTNITSGEDFPSLADALADPETLDGDTLTVNEPLLLTEQLNIDRPITIDGQGMTLTTGFAKTSNSNNSAIAVLATTGVTITDLTVRGTQSPVDSQLHGFNVYRSTGVTLQNVGAVNFRSGVVVNGSEVAVDGITTSGNIWHGINVDQPAGAPPAVLTISGTNSHAEDSPVPASGFVDGAHVPHLFVDDINRDVAIVDVAGQYQIDEVAFRGGVARVATLGAQLPAPADVTEKVSGDTAPAYDEVGWLFNRDTSTTTPFEFDRDAASIGSGSAHVLPISAANGPDKFIAEYFALESMGTFESFRYDFRIGPGGEVADSDHFYMNVYANFGVSGPTKFYDCRYNVVPTSGSTDDFTTVEFDPTQSYPVTQHGTSPATCPSQPLAMGGDATLRVFSINVGDTSTNDGDLDGFIDNVVVETDATASTFDFDPALGYLPLTPSRILDTRLSDETIGAGESLTVPVTNIGGVPETGVGAVVLNVTTVNGTHNTYLTTYPNGADRPVASSMNPRAGQTISNETIAKVGDDGSIQIYNHKGDIDIVLDVVGWMPA